MRKRFPNNPHVLNMYFALQRHFQIPINHQIQIHHCKNPPRLLLFNNPRLSGTSQTRINHFRIRFCCLLQQKLPFFLIASGDCGALCDFTHRVRYSVNDCVCKSVGDVTRMRITYVSLLFIHFAYKRFAQFTQASSWTSQRFFRIKFRKCVCVMVSLIFGSVPKFL